MKVSILALKRTGADIIIGIIFVFLMILFSDNLSHNYFLPFCFCLLIMAIFQTNYYILKSFLKLNSTKISQLDLKVLTFAKGLDLFMVIASSICVFIIFVLFLITEFI